MANNRRMALAASVVVILGMMVQARAGEPRPESFADVIAKAKPAVVCVIAARTPCKVLRDSFVDFVKPFPLLDIPGDTIKLALNIPLVVLFPFDREGIGSGFIISSDGYVITNSHVVERADKVKVELPNRKIYKAKVIGDDPFADIALLKLELPDGVELPVLPMGDSDTLKQGDWAIAIGCPLKLKWSASAGLVSSIGRNIGATTIDDLIQIEAALDSGNSGGPLINTRGEAVGINSYTLAMAENKGFSVPINMAREILDDLKEHGEPRRGMLGVTMQNITSETVEEEELAVEDGAFVRRVSFRSPASKAGIEAGDVIVEFDGRDVTETRDLSRLVRTSEIGRAVNVKAYRGKKRLTFKVKIGVLKKPFRIF